ncbi:cytosolic carboxypeptidase 2-like isoform X2 [Amphiura filiformis]|uniref:cytosolic carboxypeptidase 2-like isoform X2 n=1 Tax=Amphiura filiformis TaxID=82378 RepID=UPI003B218AF0
MHRGGSQEFHYDLNPYDSFMRNHLKHYGYYTGKNESYRSSTTNHGYDSWEQTQGFHLSDPGSDTDYENQALKGDKLDADNQFSQDQKRSTQLTFSYHAGKMVPKLREPRGLYALSKESGPQQAPRWPADMEVLPEEEQPLHINTLPSKAEPFNEQTGYEQMPQPAAEGEGRVVYFNPPTTESYFLRSRVGGSRAGCPNRAVKLKSVDDTRLLFESRFESGNLMKATQVSEFEYELQLRCDLYTDKHIQWFYFRVQNAKPAAKYRFTITNFMKPGSLYNNGMRPLMYSEHAALTKKQGWRRCGEDIKYYKNYIRRTDVKGDKSLYSLTWTVSFPYDNDTYYFAHCYPYTYSDLQRYLLNLSNDPIRSRFCKQRILCRSLAGNVVYILTITSPANTPLDAKMKRAVVVTARVHPGETNSSWMMKGFLDYLTSNSPDAKLLRDNFVFKIVPMLNPDGVIVGNYRCSLAGRDLNRNYKSVLKDSFPSVAHTKTMIKKLLEEREVTAYCDLHGHSRKQNVFIYGCENKKNPNKRLKERIFPVIMGRNAADKFSFDNCKFKVQKSKDGTGRVVMWQMGIMNSYTLEATFCGSTLGSKKRTQFTTADFEDMGYHFCDSLLDYCDPSENKCNIILADLFEKLRQDILRHLERTGTPLPENGQVDLSEDFGSGIESSTTGSDSSADDGLPVHLLALAPKLTKKKKLKSRKERDKKRNSAEKPKEKEKEQEKEKPSSGRLSSTTRNSEGDSKPGSSNKDKQMRYRHSDRSTLHSAGRERHAHHGKPEGMPVFAQERCDERTLRKSEYLEALTNAYLMSGVLKPSSQDVPSLRYSSGNVGLSGVPMAQVDGLCPHHEKALAEQFVANQLAGLQFEDDKFNWRHHAMDTAKAVEALSQREDSAAQRQHEFNNHMVTMSALHQAQKPLNDYIRNAGALPSRPHTGRRSLKSPVKSHPSPFDEQDKNELKKGYSSTTISLKTRCPSATNFTVYDGQPRAPSRERKDRPKTPKTGMERPSSSQALKRNLSSNTSSSGSPADHGVTMGQAQNQLIRSNSVASIRRPITQPVADHVIDNQDESGQPSVGKPNEGASKVHRCATEATPITDLTTYTNHHRTERSSHHFKKAQNFYGQAIMTSQERAKALSTSTSVKSRTTSKLGRHSSDDAVASFRASLGGGEEMTNTVRN